MGAPTSLYGGLVYNFDGEIALVNGVAYTNTLLAPAIHGNDSDDMPS